MHPEYAETTFGKLFECPVYQSFQFLVFDLLLWVVRCVVFIRVGEDRTRIILCVLEGKGTVTIVSYDKKLFVWGRA